MSRASTSATFATTAGSGGNITGVVDVVTVRVTSVSPVTTVNVALFDDEISSIIVVVDVVVDVVDDVVEVNACVCVDKFVDDGRDDVDRGVAEIVVAEVNDVSFGGSRGGNRFSVPNVVVVVVVL